MLFCHISNLDIFFSVLCKTGRGLGVKCDLYTRENWIIPYNNKYLPIYKLPSLWVCITQTFFKFLKNGSFLNHQWFNALLLMYNTTIFEKNYFCPLLVTFEVTALTELFLMLFGFSINYSTYLAAETNHTFKKNLEQTLT